MPSKKKSAQAKIPTKKETPQQPLYTQGDTQFKTHALPNVCHVSQGAVSPKLRSGHNRHDTDYYRPEDAIPKTHHEIMAACQAMYRRIGMVRNIIDLMADFASEGLDLRHPTKSHQRFYRKWAKKVKLNQRAHDFMRYLLRDANVIIRRKKAKITSPVRRELMKAEDVLGPLNEEKTADKPADLERLKKRQKTTKKNEIPWKYTFLSPVIIEKVGGQVGRFFGSEALAMRIPVELARSITDPKTDAEKKLIEGVPDEVKKAVKKGNNLVLLNPDTMYIEYYKKDDWDDWGTPFLYGVLEDILLKDKMKQADMAALDGVINTIRVWKLGDHTQKILPTTAAVNKLLEILQYNVGGGCKDIVWDSMIDLSIEYPPTDKILGAEKYVAVNQDIVRGLGIPDSLVGGVDLGTRNAESAYVQLKTLVERLEYIRARCIEWIEHELQMVADAMGFKEIPGVVFGTMSLRDEAAEKQLMIQLLDRNVISIERIHKVFGQDFAIELENLRTEQQIREGEPKILEKTNPYFRSHTNMDRQSDHAIELQKVKHGQYDSSVDYKGDPMPVAPEQETSDSPGGENGGGDNPYGDQPRNEEEREAGRPPNVKETKPRDRRTEKVLSVYKTMAENYIAQLDSIVDQSYLIKCGAKSARSLTKDQAVELERTKRALLSVVMPGEELCSELLQERASKNPAKVVAALEAIFNELLDEHAQVCGRKPTLKERRSLAASAWAVFWLNPIER